MSALSVSLQVLPMSWFLHVIIVQRIGVKGIAPTASGFLSRGKGTMHRCDDVADDGGRRVCGPLSCPSHYEASWNTLGASRELIQQ